ncbi:neuromedin-U isoform X1 [Cottoperca gobio]|uniref:Neuromedin-U isoform X1 n=1 Tax=Cottoperca gobio TaxID=56716 RepID=A0A6J2PIB5_COTGO|nr:neuromedin-U isoform X1 [Cottoperca gobio]XP_029285808.1 neuromedin-U isoform X1 [Cottoperca gobio]
MRTFQSQSQAAQRGASSSLHSLSSTASIALTALLILTIPVCTSAPAELQQATTGQRQILSQIDAVCSSYLSADLKIWVSGASDVLGELCVLMLFQKSKELKVQENSKRFLNSIPEEREDSQCALKSRVLGASRAEVTSFIGHEMEDGP